MLVSWTCVEDWVSICKLATWLDQTKWVWRKYWDHINIIACHPFVEHSETSVEAQRASKPAVEHRERLWCCGDVCKSGTGSSYPDNHALTTRQSVGSRNQVDSKLCQQSKSCPTKGYHRRRSMAPKKEKFNGYTYQEQQDASTVLYKDSLHEHNNSDRKGQGSAPLSDPKNPKTREKRNPVRRDERIPWK